MKTSEIKGFLKIYLKRINRLQEREIKLLWKAIKTKVKKDKEKKQPKKLPAPKKDKKLEYDTDDESDE